MNDECGNGKRIIDDITFGDRPRRTYGGGSYRPFYQPRAEADVAPDRCHSIHFDRTKLS